MYEEGTRQNNLFGNCTMATELASADTQVAIVGGEATFVQQGFVSTQRTNQGVEQAVENRFPKQTFDTKPFLFPHGCFLFYVNMV
jgi:hypothetical protein